MRTHCAFPVSEKQGPWARSLYKDQREASRSPGPRADSHRERPLSRTGAGKQALLRPERTGKGISPEPPGRVQLVDTLLPACEPKAEEPAEPTQTSDPLGDGQQWLSPISPSAQLFSLGAQCSRVRPCSPSGLYSSMRPHCLCLFPTSSPAARPSSCPASALCWHPLLPGPFTGNVPAHHNFFPLLLRDKCGGR